MNHRDASAAADSGDDDGGGVVTFTCGTKTPSMSVLFQRLETKQEKFKTSGCILDAHNFDKLDQYLEDFDDLAREAEAGREQGSKNHTSKHDTLGKRFRREQETLELYKEQQNRRYLSDFPTYKKIQEWFFRKDKTSGIIIRGRPGKSVYPIEGLAPFWLFAARRRCSRLMYSG